MLVFQGYMTKTGVHILAISVDQINGVYTFTNDVQKLIIVNVISFQT